MKQQYFFKYPDPLAFEGFSWVVLNPTGKCKLDHKDNGDIVTYIQHKGLFFKRWVLKSDIELQNPSSKTVNTEIVHCNFYAK